MIQSIALTSLIIIQQSFGFFDPDLEWKTISTEHFKIHYHSEIEDSAKKLANRVEPVYDRITDRFEWEPESKVHVVISDQTDSPNGLSSPLPYNIIYLYPPPPPDNTPLDNYDDWLTTIFMHEFTHSVHIDMVKGVNYFLRKIFGRIIVPNAAQQQWALEGLATYEETVGTTQGRGRSSFVEMFLRTAALKDDFIRIDRATYWNDQYPYGGSAYWYGIGFHQYLAEKYGEKKIYDVARENSDALIVGFFNFTTKPIYGKSFTRMWDEWRLEQRDKWKKFKADNPSKYAGKAVETSKSDNGEIKAAGLLGRTAWTAKGDSFYASVGIKKKSFLKKYSFENDGSLKTELIKKDFAASDASYHKEHLIYSKLKTHDVAYKFRDLFILDLKTKTPHRLTRALRLRDPLITNEAKIIAIQTNAFKSKIVQLPLHLPAKDKKGVTKVAKIIDQKSDLKVLYEAEGINAISKPTLSPDGKTLVFSMKVENSNRDLYALNLETAELSQITNDIYQEHEPTFTQDGTSILFTSARPFGKSEVLVPNIFSLNLENKTITQLTDAITGTRWPSLSPQRDLKKLVFGYYTENGYVLHQADYKAQEFAKTWPSNIPHEAPDLSIEPENNDYSPRPYSVGNTLLPRFILPFFFYTETDTAAGAQTGSTDPLNRHIWSALGFHFFTPQRPGGFFNYSYNGWKTASIFASIGANILNHGTILATNATGPITLVSGDYYERRYEGVLGFFKRFVGKSGASGFSLSGNMFYKFRTPLLQLPSNTLASSVSVTNGLTTIPNVTTRPERGHQWGVRSTLSWSKGIKKPVRSINPISGMSASLRMEYSPSKLGSKFHIFKTIFSAKAYKAFWGDHSVAGRIAAGAQWMNPLYQRSFRLGGSFGENPFTSVSGQAYPLRGLPPSTLQGEGMVTSSVEYRFPLMKDIPGLGTAPLWFKNLHGALFTDAGQSFQVRKKFNLVEALRQLDASPTNDIQRFQLNRFSMSIGAELRSDISITYLPPVQLRFGYGYVLFLRGNSIASSNTDQAYFLIGSSF
jgi:hypothetical protein